MGRQSRKSISVTKGVYKALAAHANKIDRSMSAIVEDLLIEHLGFSELKEERKLKAEGKQLPPRVQMTMEERWLDATRRANAPQAGMCRKEGCRIAGVHGAHE